MAQARQNGVAAAPLFDRLRSDAAPAGGGTPAPPSGNTLAPLGGDTLAPPSGNTPAPPSGDAAAALRRSVARELAVLLNTRQSRPAAAADAPRTTLDYGLPDLSAFSLGQPDERERLARLIEATIAAFEPRLARPLVRLRGTEAPGRLVVEVAGALAGSAAALRVPLGRHGPPPDDA